MWGMWTCAGHVVGTGDVDVLGMSTCGWDVDVRMGCGCANSYLEKHDVYFFLFLFALSVCLIFRTYRLTILPHFWCVLPTSQACHGTCRSGLDLYR